MEAYFAAKAALFAQAEAAVVNVGDPYGRRLAETLTDAVTFDTGSDALEGIEPRLRGRFNRENAIGAALAARALGVADDAIKRGIESVHGVPGRFESIDEGQPFAVIVDYAHTPEALETRAPRRARQLADGRLHGRLRRRWRPRPGEAAAHGRGRRRARRPGGPDLGQPARRAGGGDHRARSRRGRSRARRAPGARPACSAIELALARCAPGEIVVIAGRGAEPEQETRAAGRCPSTIVRSWP